MRVVAYCRVSTNKDEQLDSLEAQQKFFTEYSERHDYNLVSIYADEGKSGTKMKNRTQLLKLLSDANRGMFEVVLIKDVSRLARNTVDFLTSIRNLKAKNIEVVFVNYDMTTSDSSEFMLTMLSAIAQEESANTSKRVKFGKKMNAEKGKVPNFCFGYDKIKGDYFNLDINEEEAKIIKRIYEMYTEQEFGTAKIAYTLNQEGLKTKRNCDFNQHGIGRILTNQIYIGKVINGKQEVEDFLTGKRANKDQDDWFVVENPKLRIVEDEIFEKAQRIMHSRKDSYNITGKRNSEKHVFSKLIKCKCCGATFRRTVREYKNTYIRWICYGRNSKGIKFCPNNTKVDESELLDSIKTYFAGILRDKHNTVERIVKEFEKQYKAKDDNIRDEKELNKQLEKAKKDKDKYVEMFKADVITIDELRIESNKLNDQIDYLLQEIKLRQSNISKSDLLKNIMAETFKDIEKIFEHDEITNNLLSRLVERIEVDEDGNVDVYLKLITDMGLDKNVLLRDNRS